MDFNLSRKGNGNISFSFLIDETFNGRTNCENFCGAKGYELSNLSHRDFAESKESCTALLNTHIHCVPVIIQCFMIIAHWAVQVHSPQFLYAIYILYWQVSVQKGNFPYNDLLSLLANTFVERYEKTIKILLSLLLVFATEGVSQTINGLIPFVYTDRESLSARWVPKNSPMKTIYSVFCKQTN